MSVFLLKLLMLFIKSYILPMGQIIALYLFIFCEGLNNDLTRKSFTFNALICYLSIILQRPNY